ncbi:MAG: hypothetical protein V4459_09560 [Pseudomonadota bacterium]
MRRVLLALIATIATPAGAQRTQPTLPTAPRGMDYVETVCTGGIDGRFEQVRVLASGQIMKVTRRSDTVLRAKATRGEVARLWRSLDLSRFERRTVVREKPFIADGIDCSLTRRKNGLVHVVTLLQQIRDRAEYRDLTRVIDDVNGLGGRATGPILRPAGAR